MNKIKCKVEDCNFEASDLTVHIIRVHKMKINEYQNKYSSKIIDEKLIEKRVVSRKNKYTTKCEICSAIFSSEVALNHHFKMAIDIEHSHFIYNEFNKEEWIECKICRFRAPTLKYHIRLHNLKVEDYYSKYAEVNSKNNLLKLEELKKESRIKNFKFICEICSEHFKTEQSLHEHLINSNDLEHNHLLYNNSNSKDWIECKICGMRKKVILEHLKITHNLTSKQYLEQYDSSVFSENYYNNSFMKFVNEGAKNQQRHETRKSHRNISCPVCFEMFASQEGLDKHIILVDDKEHSSLIYDDLHPDDWIECKICGCRRARIDFHIKSKHGLSCQVYKKDYGDFLSINYLKKIKDNGCLNHESYKYEKEKNPFYNKQHSVETKKQISTTLLNKTDREKKMKILQELVEQFENQKQPIEDILNELKNI